MRLTEIIQHRKPVEEVCAGLLSASNHESTEAGMKLVAKARDAGVSVSDYLILAVDTNSGEVAKRTPGLNGFEQALAHLNLPFRDSYEHGVVLQAAADTFQTYTGTRAMFPEVIDQLLKYKARQEQIENTAALVSQTRVINQVEMITTFMDDTAGEDDTFTIAEMGRIPVRKISTSQNSVKMWKHGSGYQFSYEFNRRMSLDIITPFASRVARRLEISKVRAATLILINGDGVNAAAATDTLGAYGGDFAGGKTLKNNYQALAKFLMTKAKAGYPIDTLVTNFDNFVELMLMFTPTTLGNRSEAATLIAERGLPAINTNLPILNGSVNVVLSSAVPAGKIVAMIKGETLEELVEAGSNLTESERSIENQSIMYVKSEVTGYKIAMPDTRFYLDTTV